MTPVLTFLCTIILAVASFSTARASVGAPSDAQDSTDRVRTARRYFIAGTTLQLQGNRHAEAILEFQESLRFDSAVVTLVAIARSYIELKKLDRAETYVQLALARDSVRSEAWELLAELHIASGRYDDGIVAYERILKLEPTRRQLYTLARLYEPRDARKAIGVFERLATDDPSPELYLRIAGLYDRLRDQGAVIETLEKGRTLDRRNVELSARLIESYVSAGRVSDAVSVAVDWKRSPLDGSSATAVWGTLLQSLLQDSLVAQLHLSETQRIVDSACARFSQSYPLTSLAAAVALSIGDRDRGLQAVEMASEMVQYDADALMQQAGMVLGFGYPSMAASLLLTWQPLHAANPRYLQAIGDAYVSVPDVDQALPYYYVALELDPSLTDVWLQLGSIYDRMEQADSAMACYAMVLQLDPMNPMALNNYAYMLAEQGRDLDKARIWSYRALQQNPDLPAYLDTYAWVLYQRGEYSEARLFIERAIQVGGSATHYEHLGFILEQLGDLDGAVRAWKMCLEKDPTRSNVQNRLDRYR